MSAAKYKKLIYIFILALGLRLWFLSSVYERQVFLYGDASNYDGSAIGMIEMFKNAWPSLHLIVSEALKGNLGKGMNVLHPLGIHFSIVVFTQGPIYPSFIALIYTAFGHDVHMVQYMQAFLGGISCLLLFFAARAAFDDDRIGFLASALWALYIPSIYFTELVLTETLSATVLLTALILFLRINKTKGPAAFFLSGLGVAFLMLTRHSFRFLWIFIAAGLFFSLRDIGIKEVLRKITIFLCAVAILLIPWMTLVGFATGKFMGLPTNKDYWRELSINNDVRYDGWPPDSTIGHAKIESPSPYKKIFFKNLRERPFRTSLLYFEKMRRVWDRSSNFRDRKFLVPDPIFAFAHRLLVYLGLFGIAACLIYWRKLIFLLIAVFYVTVMSSIILVEARYNFVVMPIIFIFASYFSLRLWDAIGSIYKRPDFKKEIGLTLGCLAAFLAVRTLAMLPVTAIFTALSYRACHIIKMALDAASLFFIIPPVRIIFRDILSYRALMYVSFVPVSILLIFGLVGGAEDRNWSEWQSPIKKGYAVEKDIYLPGFAKAPNLKEASLLIDMYLPEQNHLKIAINGDEYLYKSMNAYTRFTPEIYNDIFKMKSLRPGAMRQWHVIPISLDYIKNDVLKIRLSCVDLCAAGTGYTVVFGDYRMAGEKIYEGPKFARSQEEASFVKLCYDADYRLLGTELLYNRDTQDRLYIDGEYKGRDLSNTFGLQAGEYRIRLEVIGQDGEVKTY